MSNIEQGRGAVEARADGEIGDRERADNIVAAFELLVEHRQEAGERVRERRP